MNSKQEENDSHVERSEGGGEGGVVQGKTRPKKCVCVAGGGGGW